MSMRGPTHLGHGINLHSAPHPAHADSEGHGALRMLVLESIAIFCPVIPACPELVVAFHVTACTTSSGFILIHGSCGFGCRIVNLDICRLTLRPSFVRPIVNVGRSHEPEVYRRMYSMDQCGDSVGRMRERRGSRVGKEGRQELEDLPRVKRV